MGLGVLISYLAASFLFIQPIVASDHALSPVFAPVFNGICDAIECGKGTCNASSNFTFTCECNPGWSQFHIGDDFKFMPCVIPNCSLNYDCNNASALAPAPSSLPDHTNHSIIDPCKWSYCGEGTCVRTSQFGHRCDCKEGFTNILNVTNFPCFSDCGVGADCKTLGIGVSNRSSSTPSLSENGGASNQDGSSPLRNAVWSTIFVISLAMVPLL
ncbi:uncharacterized protein LOC131249399 [Magnolia sinica]|uniref:uncharacterized protein LOC131249399 n=1 Tax=Magnolia sinica TaxID=86752 RepID=UPI00265923E0|nr:uncharacterized protein LOC131249399 [Magnolia sinica]